MGRSDAPSTFDLNTTVRVGNHYDVRSVKSSGEMRHNDNDKRRTQTNALLLFLIRVLMLVLHRCAVCRRYPTRVWRAYRIIIRGA